MTELHGRVALVTGGGGGLGRRIADRLGRSGCHVAVHFQTSEASAEETVAAVRAAGGKAAAFRADLSVAASARQLVDDVMQTFGGVQILVNNAATTRFIPWEDAEAASDEIWRTLLDVNLLAPVALVRAVLPAMAETGWGRVLNIASTSALGPTGSSLPYAVSKAALVAYTRNLAAVAPEGVSVCAIAPGWMDTPWASRHAGSEERPVASAGGEPEVDVDDVAELAVGLVRSPAANGSVLELDAGTGLRHAHEAP